MSHAKSQNLMSTAALLVYGAVVVVPLGLLFSLVALQRRPAQPGRGNPAAAVAPPLPTTGRDPEAPGLPPFDAYGAEEAPSFPDLLLAPVDGGPPQRLSAVHSGPAIVHLWSLACETCADEWPVQRAFVAEHTGPGREFPPVVSILVVPDPGDDAAAAARQGLAQARAEGWFGRPVPDLSVPWAVAEDDVLARAEMPTLERPITGYPETFVLDGRGRTRLRLVGPVAWDLPTWGRLMSMLPDLPRQAGPTAVPPGHPPVPGGPATATEASAAAPPPVAPSTETPASTEGPANESPSAAASSTETPASTEGPANESP